MNMEEKDFENALNQFTQNNSNTEKAADANNTESSAAEMRSAADAIVENAAANTEAVQKAEAAASDDTMVIDAEIVSNETAKAMDNTQSLDDEYNEIKNATDAAAAGSFGAEAAAGSDTAATGSIDAGAVNNKGFAAGNPQYEEHAQNYRISEDSQSGNGGSYGGGGYRQSRPYQANPGFITKKAFVIILILAMIFTMVASIAVTTAYSTYLNSKIEIPTDNHATNYTLTQSDESLSYKSIIDKTENSIVSITTEAVTNDIWMQNYITQGAGSGVIIQSDGYIITCEHVIEGARKITVTTHDGKEYDAKIVGADADNDIAVIKIDATGLQAATYGDSSKLEVGDATVVIGNPLGTLSGTVTTGIISALDRKLTIDGKELTLLQTDASINPGNSGGGMFDASGNLIGIVEAKSTGSDIDGLGFATPVNKAAKIAKNLIENEGKTDTDDDKNPGSSSDARIGIMVTEVDESIAKQYGYAHGGLLVRSVTSTQASLAGLNQGDIIYKAEGKTVKTQEELTKILSGMKVGDKLKLSVARDDGSTDELKTVLVSEADSNR